MAPDESPAGVSMPVVDMLFRDLFTVLLDYEHGISRVILMRTSFKKTRAITNDNAESDAEKRHGNRYG
jgi:hypothetical protein